MGIETMRIISITVNIVCVMICLLLEFLYFSKKNITTQENSIYDGLLIVNTICLILELIFYLTTFTNKNLLYVNFIEKAYFASNCIWIFLHTLYIIVISKFNSKFNDWDLKKKKYITISCMIGIILTVFLLPVDNIYENGKLIASSGMSTSFVFLFCFGLTVFSMILVLVKIKTIEKNKVIPLFVFIFLILIELIASAFGVQLLLMTLPMTLVSFLMYHTIENPDVKMIEELELAKDRADKANAAKTDFLSNMSHEIRTPLNAIVGFSQNLYEENITDTAKDQVKDIITASNNLLELVNGILDISKIEANKLEIINDEYSFKRVFDELCSLAHARMGDKDLILKTQYDESIPKVLYGDKLRVKQVILNILTNSIKYTKKGFVEFKISSIIKDDVCRLIISVEDSGIGIKQENIEKLFTKFQRFEEKNSTIEGTGLGLAITKKLVELMNGQIIVQSVYGQGSKFTIALDQRIINNPTISLEEDSKITLDSETYDLTGKKVLVVDDNNLNLKVASKLLSKYNLTLELVTSGRECLEKIQSGSTYDLVLLDDMMPKMSGVETLAELKKIEGYNIPTVILTANAIAGMREKYLRDGFDDYLAKPIDKGELNKVLKEFVMKN